MHLESRSCTRLQSLIPKSCNEPRKRVSREAWRLLAPPDPHILDSCLLFLHLELALFPNIQSDMFSPPCLVLWLYDKAGVGAPDNCWSQTFWLEIFQDCRNNGFGALERTVMKTQLHQMGHFDVVPSKCTHELCVPFVSFLFEDRTG